jgi:transposase
VVIDAVHAAAMLKSGFRNKTDRNDARGIADMMRVNKFRAVWIKSPEGRDRRALLAAREQLVKMRTALTNTLRGLLRGRGLCMKAGSRRGLVGELHELVSGDPALGEIVSPLLATLEVVEREVAGFDSRVVKRAKGDEVCRLLMTRMGVGPITAFSFQAAVDDPHRFRRSRDVGAYFGITPRRHQSGAVDYSGHISRMGDQAVRRALYMAAHTIMCGGPRDSLSAWALNLAKRRGAKRAKVALARRLAVILHRMWLDGTPYRADHPATVRKAA